MFDGVSADKRSSRRSYAKKLIIQCLSCIVLKCSTQENFGNITIDEYAAITAVTCNYCDPVISR